MEKINDINQIIDNLLEDLKNEHYYEMYDIIEDNNKHDGLYICIDEEYEGNGIITIKFAYPKPDLEEFVEIPPDREVLRKEIDKAIEKAKPMLEIDWFKNRREGKKE